MTSEMLAAVLMTVLVACGVGSVAAFVADREELGFALIAPVWLAGLACVVVGVVLFWVEALGGAR